MRNFKYIWSVICIVVLAFLIGCEGGQCYCVETTTEIGSSEVTVFEYWTDDCDYPFTSTETYSWGNRTTDCR